jgi:hypothetical protein
MVLFFSYLVGGNPVSDKQFQFGKKSILSTGGFPHIGGIGQSGQLCFFATGVVSGFISLFAGYSPMAIALFTVDNHNSYRVFIRTEFHLIRNQCVVP